MASSRDDVPTVPVGHGTGPRYADLADDLADSIHDESSWSERALHATYRSLASAGRGELRANLLRQAHLLTEWIHQIDKEDLIA